MSITQKLSNEKIFSLREVLAKGPYTQNPRGFRWARKETFFRLWEYRGRLINTNKMNHFFLSQTK